MKEMTLFLFGGYVFFPIFSADELKMVCVIYCYSLGGKAYFLNLIKYQRLEVSIHLSICLSMYLSYVCLSIYPSLHPFIYTYIHVCDLI